MWSKNKIKTFKTKSSFQAKKISIIHKIIITEVKHYLQINHFLL